jgi:hypothetical protein
MCDQDDRASGRGSGSPGTEVDVAEFDNLDQSKSVVHDLPLLGERSREADVAEIPLSRACETQRAA